MNAKTHDLTPKVWGRDYAITQILQGGLRVYMTVWCPDEIVVGDYLLIRNGAHSTRYQVERVVRPHDPGDQYFIQAQFTPRPAPQQTETASQGVSNLPATVSVCNTA